MKLVLPDRIGFRGAGLGNEAIVWAKAFLAAEAVGGRCLDPVWGLSKRNYRRYFATSRFDWLWQGGLKCLLPTFHFGESEYRASGKEDYGDAFRVWASECGLLHRQHWAVTIDGIGGGFWAIRRARSFIHASLGCTRFTQENLTRILKKIDPEKPLCVVHLRAGDFHSGIDGENLRGRFNVRLSMTWYDAAITAVREAAKDNINIIVVSNDRSESTDGFIARHKAISTLEYSDSDISDLLIMAEADVVVPSISSFSMLSLFLGSDSIYLWPRNHLSPVNGVPSLSGIWAGDADQKFSDSPTLSMAQARGADPSARCFAFSEGESLDSNFAVRIAAVRELRSRNRDLLYYGTVRS